MIFVNKGDDFTKHECLTKEEFVKKYSYTWNTDQPSEEVKKLTAERKEKRVCLRVIAGRMRMKVDELGGLEGGHIKLTLAIRDKYIQALSA